MSWMQGFRFARSVRRARLLGCGSISLYGQGKCALGHGCAELYTSRCPGGIRRFSLDCCGRTLGKARRVELLPTREASILYGTLGTRTAASVASQVQRDSTRCLFTEPSKDHATLNTLSGSDAGISMLVLHRPEARNAVGDVMLEQLKFIVENLRYDPVARVLVISSDVPGVFCAGADIKERRTKTTTEVEKYVSTLRSTFAAIEALPIPSIAVIEGAALGGGLELALSCDLRVAGKDAVFGLPETSLAIIPGAGGTQRLPRLTGTARAKELIFTARKIKASDAEDIGLVNHCVGPGEALEKALEIAREILQQGPIAVKMAKLAIDRGVEVEVSSGMIIEQACYAQTLHTKDRLEGLAAFAEKRKPSYRGE